MNKIWYCTLGIVFLAVSLSLGVSAKNIEDIAPQKALRSGFDVVKHFMYNRILSETVTNGDRQGDTWLTYNTGTTKHEPLYFPMTILSQGEIYDVSSDGTTDATNSWSAERIHCDANDVSTDQGYTRSYLFTIEGIHTHHGTQRLYERIHVSCGEQQLIADGTSDYPAIPANHIVVGGVVIRAASDSDNTTNGFKIGNFTKGSFAVTTLPTGSYAKFQSFVWPPNGPDSLRRASGTDSGLK